MARRCSGASFANITWCQKGRNKAAWKSEFESHGARPVHQIISMIKWIQTRRLSIKLSLSLTWYRVRHLGLRDS